MSSKPLIKNMELATVMDTTEDSGFAGSISGTYESTPNNSQPSRKRKYSRSTFLSDPSVLTSLIDSPIISPHLLSSTCNESLIARSLENCNISSVTPQLFTNLEGSKSKKLCSPPTTPMKSDFFKRRIEQFRTPNKISSLQKLGSPEHNEILYGKEIRSNNVYKYIPEKRCSPAKKKLFGENKSLRRSSLLPRPERKDPVVFFTVLRHNEEIMQQIFSYVSDKDLCRVRFVSRSWKKFLSEDKLTFTRMNSCLKVILNNKENSRSIIEKRWSVDSIVKPTIDPSKSCTFIKAASTLRNCQKLGKCPQCGRESIIEANIGQCQKVSCGYVYCIQCDSFSTTGPENFTDKCMSSSLIVEKSFRGRRSLLDSPEKSNNPLAFFSDSVYPKAPYSPDLLVTPPVLTSTRRRRFFSAYNIEVADAKPMSPKEPSYVPVVPIKHTHKMEVVDPPSPPSSPSSKKYVACSSASKKNLKRLARF